MSSLIINLIVREVAKAFVHVDLESYSVKFNHCLLSQKKGAPSGLNGENETQR
ncbi:hypothetical protein OSB94_13515 [Proteus vulgaris]|uniref:hypothetical protein n=1 Tax=Proteus vulgaris TaxID=585 RepID=UPI0028746E18|nr:hypothetical protein [Proteus vulgaris]MDS0789116.1 hypothetical protein [Proteus vulgaris]